MAATAMDYNPGLPRDLDVTPIFTDLMKAATGQSSIYLKAKATVLDYVEKGHLTEVQKAEVLAKTITDLTNGMTAQALQAAVEIAKENRDAPVVYLKAVEDTKLINAQMQKTIIDANKADMETDLTLMAIKKAQAELTIDYGVTALAAMPDWTVALAYNASGTKHESIKMAQANVYNGYATAYRQNGVVFPVIDSVGWLTTGTSADTHGLNYWQAKVAERQEKGFDDNTRQLVANSSATMVSMLLSSEEAALVDDASAALAKWTTAVDYLNNA
jgi:hypothetical protein